MSTKYKRMKDVPTSALVSRLDELARAVADGREAVEREFTMRIPAELDRDADVVLSEAARRLQEYHEALVGETESDRKHGWLSL